MFNSSREFDSVTEFYSSTEFDCMKELLLTADIQSCVFEYVLLSKMSNETRNAFQFRVAIYLSALQNLWKGAVGAV